MMAIIEDVGNIPKSTSPKPLNTMDAMAELSASHVRSLSDLQRELESVAREMSIHIRRLDTEMCVCGNFFVEGSIFCGNCGQRRINTTATATPSQISSHGHASTECGPNEPLNIDVHAKQMICQTSGIFDADGKQLVEKQLQPNFQSDNLNDASENMEHAYTWPWTGLQGYSKAVDIQGDGSHRASLETPETPRTIDRDSDDGTLTFDPAGRFGSPADPPDASSVGAPAYKRKKKEKMASKKAQLLTGTSSAQVREPSTLHLNSTNQLSGKEIRNSGDVDPPQRCEPPVTKFGYSHIHPGPESEQYFLKAQEGKLTPLQIQTESKQPKKMAEDDSDVPVVRAPTPVSESGESREPPSEEFLTPQRQLEQPMLNGRQSNGISRTAAPAVNGRTQPAEYDDALTQPRKRMTLRAHADDSHDDALKHLKEFASQMIAEHEAHPDEQANQKPGGAFTQGQDLKDNIKKTLMKPEYKVSNYYRRSGTAQKICRSPNFEKLTMCMIAINGLWLGVDAEYNKAEISIEAHPFFLIVDQLFCLFFFVELMLRYFAFEVKMNALKDRWFVFDSFLVVTMVFDSWLLNIFFLIFNSAGAVGGIFKQTTVLRLFRLLRLLRISRMAKLLRSMPEIMVVINGMTAATRTVAITLFILLSVVYVFAITLHTLLTDSDETDEYFGSIKASMHTLLISGAFPDLNDIMRLLMDIGFGYWLVYVIFAFFACVTIMNMMVGVLVEIVKITSDAERESLDVCFLKDCWLEILERHGFTNIRTPGEIWLKEDDAWKLMDAKEAICGLQEVGVDVLSFVDYSHFMFNHVDKMSFPSFLEMALQFRSSNTCTVKDLVDLRRYVSYELDEILKGVRSLADELIEDKASEAMGATKTLPFDHASTFEGRYSTLMRFDD